MAITIENKQKILGLSEKSKETLAQLVGDLKHEFEISSSNNTFTWQYAQWKPITIRGMMGKIKDLGIINDYHEDDIYAMFTIETTIDNLNQGLEYLTILSRISEGIAFEDHTTKDLQREEFITQYLINKLPYKIHGELTYLDFSEFKGKEIGIHNQDHFETKINDILGRLQYIGIIILDSRFDNDHNKCYVITNVELLKGYHAALLDELEKREKDIEQSTTANSNNETKIHYDSTFKKLTIANFEGEANFKGAKKQQQLCEVLFKNTENIKQQWTWDQIIEDEMHDISGQVERKRLYSTAREIVIKVKNDLGIKDLLDTSTEGVQVNQKYI